MTSAAESTMSAAGRILFAAVLFLTARIGEAQPSLAGEASHTFRPAVPLDGAPGVDVRVSTVQTAVVAVRIPVGSRTFLTPGVSYQGHFLHYSGAAPPETADALHTLEIPLMVFHVLDQDWSLLGRLAPGLSGDFVGLDRHFRLSALGLAVYRFSPRLAVGFGAVLSYGAGRWLPLPVVRVDWEIMDGLHLEALVPASVKTSYRFGNRWEVGALVQFEGARWAVDSEAEARTIDYFAFDVGGQLGMRIAGTTWINLFAGWNAWRRYDIEGGPRAGDYDPEPGVVIRGGLEIRLPGQ